MIKRIAAVDIEMCVDRGVFRGRSDADLFLCVMMNVFVRCIDAKLAVTIVHVQWQSSKVSLTSLITANTHLIRGALHSLSDGETLLVQS